MALGESLTMTGVGRFGLDYGRIRLWGSLSFILAATASGHVLVEAPPSAILWMVLATVAATALACAVLPDLRTDAAPVSAGLPLARVLADRGLILMLAAAGLIQGSHAVYYAFGTLHWQAAGISDDVIGLLWAEGVVCEIVLFAAGGAVLRRIRPPWLIAIAGGLAALRWLVLGIDHGAAGGGRGPGAARLLLWRRSPRRDPRHRQGGGAGPLGHRPEPLRGIGDGPGAGLDAARLRAALRGVRRRRLLRHGAQRRPRLRASRWCWQGGGDALRLFRSLQGSTRAIPR